jgi:hypothetical protein
VGEYSQCINVTEKEYMWQGKYCDIVKSSDKSMDPLDFVEYLIYRKINLKSFYHLIVFYSKLGNKNRNLHAISVHK